MNVWLTKNEDFIQEATFLLYSNISKDNNPDTYNRFAAVTGVLKQTF